jgi:hypothetical protein
MPNLKNKTKFTGSSVVKNSGWLEKYGNGGKTLEEKINKALGDPRKKAADAAINKKWFNKETKKWEVEDDNDSFRHTMAARYTAEAISNKFPDWMKYSGIPQVAGFVGSTALGVAHELANNKYTSNDPKDYPNYTFWNTLTEAGEDTFNDIAGAGVGVLPISDDKKTAYLRYLSDNNKIPDGYANKQHNMYFKRNGGLIDTYENGGWLDQYGDEGDFNDYKRPGPVEDRSTGMTGMMKSKIATEAHYGNPSALRMVSPNPNKYTFTGKELDWEGNQASPEGYTGTHFMGSYDDQARPGLQEVDGKMQYFQNPPYNSKENFNFSRPEDAEHFASYYKEVAPMMRNYEEYKNGGWLEKYGDGGLKSVTGPAPKLDAKTIAEGKRIASSYNNANKQNAQISQTRNWSQAEKAHSDMVKDRINNPASDVGILGANMASNITRFRNLTPEEIARTTDNVGETVNLSSEMLKDGLINELVGYGATKAIPFVSKSAKAAGKYLTEETALKNAYKVNPFAFKPNPEAYYRMVGKEGIKDATESGVIRANQKIPLADNGEPFGGMTTPEFDVPYFSKSRPFDGRNYNKTPYYGSYEGPGMIEVKNTGNFKSLSPRADYIGLPKSTIKTSDDAVKLYQQDWLQGYKEVPKELSGSSNASSLLERINLERQGVKTKSNVIKENIQDGNFKITSRSTPSKGLVNVNIESPTGAIQATRNPDGSYGLSFKDANPFNAGKSMLKLKDKLAGKTIHETKSFSTDSYANILKLKKKLPFEEAGFLPLNSSNKANNFLDDLVIKNNNEWSASSKFKSEESAIEGAKRIDDYMLKLGETTKSKVVNNNGKFEVHVPNYKIKVPEVNNTFKTLQNKQDNSQWLNKYK